MLSILAIVCSVEEYDYSEFDKSPLYENPNEENQNEEYTSLEGSLKQTIVQFRCSFNLAPQESAKVIVKSYINVRCVNYTHSYHVQAFFLNEPKLITYIIIS